MSIFVDVIGTTAGVITLYEQRGKIGIGRTP